MCGDKGRRFSVLFKRNWISWFQKISIWSYWLTNKAYLSTITVTNISRSFTHKMAAKTSWHRYGTKLRHRHPMYILKLNKTCTFAKAKRELEVVCGMSAAARTSGNIVYRRCWRGTVCRNSNANKINLYRSMFLDVQLVMFTQRSNAFARHSLHACMSSACTSANCSQSLHICRYTCSGQNFSGHVTWLMCIFNSDNNLLSTGL